MAYKHKPSTTVTLPALYKFQNWGSQPETWSYEQYTLADEEIIYRDGRKLPNGRWPWKECTHEVNGYVNVCCGIASDQNSYTDWQGQRSTRWYNIPKADLPPLPDREWDTSVLQHLLDQVDLNTSDAVLLYSGVLQAVPLLGQVSTFLRTINHVASDVLRRFRKRPFTTALKSLISADFIDRFVITPTLDDVRKFQDATDYVLRVIQTARERNESVFALDSASTEVVSKSVSTGYLSGSGGWGSVQAQFSQTQMVTSKAFMLLEAKYDMTAVDPLKMWAQRVGLTRPLDSVWDLVPFSFVIDYFTRAGDFISALSDEMSSVQGLCGTITKIHDLWGTHTVTSERIVKPLQGPQYSPVYQGNQLTWNPSEGIQRHQRFRRFQVENPWLVLSSLSRGSLSDFLSINLDLSATRKRTIAELVIQAKL